MISVVWTLLTRPHPVAKLFGSANRILDPFACVLARAKKLNYIGRCPTAEWLLGYAAFGRSSQRFTIAGFTLAAVAYHTNAPV